MSSIIKSLNLFPQTRFWRIDKKPELSHTFGGVSSIIAILIITAIFVLKLIEVFSKTTMAVTSLSIYQKDLTTTFNTQMENTVNKPNMLLFHNTTSNINIRVYTSPSKWIFEGEQLKQVPLQLCTAEHFKAFSGQLDYQNLTQYYYNPLCLPLNQTYNLHSQNLLIMDAICKSDAVCSYLDILTIKIIYPTPNAYEKESEPWIYDYQDIDFTFEEQSMRTINIQMQEERIITDHSLFPLQKQTQTVSGLTATIPPRDQLIVSHTSFRRIILNGKNVYHFHNRTFFKVLDALSYIGGIFNTLLAGFFIIKLYGQAFFEMDFAFRFFHRKEAHNYGFFSFLKQQIWGVLKSAGCIIAWPKGQQRQRLRNTVQQMLDVIYLQHRINYLQKAITVLFEPHHQKGLQLVKSQQSEIQANCSKHRFRNQVITSLKNRSSLDFDAEQLSLQASRYRRSKNREDNLEEGSGNQSQTYLKHQKWLEMIFERPFKSNNNNKDPNKNHQIKYVEREQIVPPRTEELAPSLQTTQTEIMRDLQLLLHEAEQNSDEKSRKIVDLLDEEMRECLTRQFKPQSIKRTSITNLKRNDDL